MQSPSTLIGTKEAAEILDVDPATVTRWANDGRLPNDKLPGQTGAFVYKRADVEQLRDEIRAEVDA